MKKNKKEEIQIVNDMNIYNSPKGLIGYISSISYVDFKNPKVAREIKSKLKTLFTNYKSDTLLGRSCLSPADIMEYEDSVMAVVRKKISTANKMKKIEKMPAKLKEIEKRLVVLPNNSAISGILEYLDRFTTEVAQEVECFASESSNIFSKLFVTQMNNYGKQIRAIEGDVKSQEDQYTMDQAMIKKYSFKSNYDLINEKK